MYRYFGDDVSLLYMESWMYLSRGIMYDAGLLYGSYDVYVYDGLL